MEILNLKAIKVLLKGGGDLASGIGYRLNRAGFRLLVVEKPEPTAIRRTVSFASVIYQDQLEIEGVTGKKVINFEEVNQCWQKREVPVITTNERDLLAKFKPDIIIDARMLKEKTDQTIDEAELVIGIGPGFTINKNCNLAVETNRGHHLGRVITEGSTAENTGSPGNVNGYTDERVIHAPEAGVFQSDCQIGQKVKAGAVVGRVNDKLLKVEIDGVIRGLLKPGIKVKAGTKLADVDPRSEKDYCYYISDKALAVAGGVLEAIFYWYNSENMEGVL
ncbi:MAG: selenium-dependent molybdenum cofactor biosynthesis protein YqeB [Bacillota bacterium]